ncbi:MAG: tetratricopeptide repeat protein [Planctomycetes bacterium]|nr:tetratricopeptide repeat protein [Planctomycetota bacterium]
MMRQVQMWPITQSRERCSHTSSHRGVGDATVLVLIVTLACAFSPDVVRAEDTFFDRLQEHTRALESVDEKAREIIAEAIADLADPQANVDPDALLIEILVLISPEFREALDAYDEDGASPELVATMKKLATSSNPYVGYNANLFVVRQLVELEQLVEAEARIAEMVEGIDAFNEHAFGEADLRYMLGYCQLHNLKHEEARQTLEDFLTRFPDASPRFVVTAKQMLAELARRIPKSIGEVADLMSFSHKRLAAADTGERVVSAQERVIELLDELIKQAEEAENQQSSSGDSKPNPRSQKNPKDQSQSPAKDPKTPNGGSQQSAKRAGRRVTPGEAWGTMPDADREKILQVLRDRFPGRYRALVEQYYQSLAEQP